MVNKRLGVVLGGGGFVSETITLLRNTNLPDTIFIVSGGHHLDLRAVKSINALKCQRMRIWTISNPTQMGESLIIRLFLTLISFFEAFIIVRISKITHLLCIGSYLGLPLAFWCKLFGRKIIFIETVTRVNKLSLTGLLFYRLRLFTKFYVHYESISKKFSKTIYTGSIV
jgi:hypothetical protein